MLSILIADCNTSYALELESAFRSTDVFSEIMLVSDGKTALECLQSRRYDAILLETALPGIDGVEILERIRDIPECDGIRKFLNSSIVNDTIYGQCLKHKLSYLFLKPNDPQVVVQRITEFCVDFSRPSEKHMDIRAMKFEKIITDYLLNIGMPAHLKGFQFSRMAINLACQMPSGYFTQVTKDIYPRVATFYGGSPSQVERNIRSAVEAVWNRRYMPERDKLFNPNRFEAGEVPSNADFILCLTENAIQAYNLTLIS